MIFDRAWFTRHQAKLLWLLNCRLTKKWFRRVLKIDHRSHISKLEPNAIHWPNPDGSFTGEYQVRAEYSERLFYAFKPLWWTLHIWDLLADRTSLLPSASFATLTVYPDANPETTSVDGIVYRTGANETFSTIRAGAGTLANDSTTGLYQTAVSLFATATTNQYEQLSRSIFLFDTSSLTSGAAISAATLSLWIRSKNNSLGMTSAHAGMAIVGSTPASNTALVAADYGNLGTTRYATDIAYDSVTIGAYNDFTLNATGLTNISKTSVTKFGARFAVDVDNGSPAWTAYLSTSYEIPYADWTGTTQDPKLVVTYVLGFTNPTNAYTSNDTYATATAASGAIDVALAGDGGTTYTSVLTKTYTGVEAVQTYGNGSTELWGRTWTGDDVDDTSFRLKITVGNAYHIFKTFGFAIGASTILTGIEVTIEAKWDGATTSIDHVRAKIYYGTSVSPVQAGSQAYDSTLATMTFYNGSAWLPLVSTTATQTLTNKSITESQIVFSATGHDHTGTTAGNLIPTGGIENAAVTADKLSTGAATNSVATSQTTTSTSYTDLATSGPAVTVTIGANGLALVIISCYQFNSGAGETYMSFAVSGASTVAAATETASTVTPGTSAYVYSFTKLVTGLTAGSNTFTAKYAVSSGTGTFRSRLISVIPL